MSRARRADGKNARTVDDGIKVITIENIDNRGDVYKRI